MAASVCSRLSAQLVQHVTRGMLVTTPSSSSLLVQATVGLQFLSVRHGSFFNKKPAQELWDSVTSVSNQGRKRGRASRGKLMRRENLNRGRRLGDGASGIQIPGFNAPVVEGKVKTKLQEQKEIDADYFDKMRKKREETKGFKHSYAMPAFLRGYSGRFIAGRQIGAPESTEDFNLEGFSTVVLKEKRTCYVTRTQGNMYRYNSLVVIGNKKGLAGFAVGKSTVAATARKSARRRAANYLQYFEPYEDRTLWHNFHEQFHRTKITAYQDYKGHGLMCHRVIRSICEVVGIKDMYAKVEGNRKNALAITCAFFNGLSKQKNHQELADELGHYIVEKRRERYFHTEIKAAPSETANKDFVKDVDFDFKTHFFGGRIPLVKKRHRFYENFGSYRFKSFIKYKNRNQAKAREERIILGLEKEPKYAK